MSHPAPPAEPPAFPSGSVPPPPSSAPVAKNRGGGAAMGRRHNAAESFQNKWATAMWSAPCTHPAFCLMACLCPWCCACRQRRQLLEGDMTRYVCCANICGPCTSWTNSMAQSCPTFCLCLEVICCLGCAVHGNRWLVQQRYQLENECCDLALMWLSCICSCLACITGEDSLQLASDLLFYIVIGCMMAQHDYELKSRGFPNEGPANMQMQ
eukprot:GGOE01043605.1.p1 GENE.GGOE01043605.1~~GGOE01043605.1.p1  ORF type:complete len:225 (+),score=33.99 GGOE01043605.1:45-677(+)